MYLRYVAYEKNQGGCRLPVGVGATLQRRQMMTVIYSLLASAKDSVGVLIDIDA